MKDLKNEITKLKEKKNAVILAHYYVEPEVQKLQIMSATAFILQRLQKPLKQTPLFSAVSNLWANQQKF